MTTAEILREDRKKLAQIDGAIMSLKREINVRNHKYLCINS